MDKISVIVPVYKVYNYLEKCFNSIANQTYKNLEIILVDDGSPDDCGKLCDELALRDKRVKVIHKPNGGLSDARNRGIEEATGEFLSFVDSDDYIDEDMISYLHENLVKHKADISTCAIQYLKNSQKTIFDENHIEGLFESEEAIKQSLYGPLSSVSACNKLFKKCLFEEIKFPVGITHEDAYTIPKIFLKANKIYMSSTPKYNYNYMRDDSITTKPFNEKNLDLVEAFITNKKIVTKVYPSLADVFQYRIYLAYIEVFKKIIISANYKQSSYYKELKNKIKSGTGFIINSPYFSKKNKLLIFIFYICPAIYEAIMKKHLR